MCRLERIRTVVLPRVIIMRNLFISAFSFIFAIVFISGVTAQNETAIKPLVFTGDVVSVDPNSIVLKTADGEITAQLSGQTSFKRVDPAKPSLATAVDAELSDIGAGDRVIVTGVPSNDRKSVPARAVYLMTKADIASKNAAEAARWASRGISGRVASVNPDTQQVTVEVRGLMGSTNIVINPKDDAVFKRYAPDSEQYSEAIVGSVADISAGDMIRALGDRSADGMSFAAEEILSGAFQTVAGTVKTVDAERREITITDLNTKNDIVVFIGQGSELRTFPAEMAQRMAGMQALGAAGGARPGGPGAGARPGGQAPPAGAGAGGQQAGPGGPGARPGMGGARAGGIDDMFDRLPQVAVADLKVGEMVAVSSSKKANGERITAIKLVAGVEPFIRAAQMAAGAQGGGRGDRTGSFSIPGLDGFDIPGGN